ncbi:MAG: PD-(D/E)XK nuclease family protein [Pseudomonadota bacterium]
MEIYNKLFEILMTDDLILTPNKRLIGFLHKHYSAYQQIQKKIVWSTPLILTLENWLVLQWEKQLIQHTIFSYRLLNKQQECLIWQSIIENANTSFLMSDTIANSAQQAWQLYHHWQLDYASSRLDQSHETRTWKTWAENFIAFSQAHACIDFARATTQLIDLFRKKILTPPQRIFLMGFDEINPQTKILFHVLEQSGCQITTFTPRYPKKPIVRRIRLENTEIELETMARWAYQRCQAGHQSIVCAVPQLLEIRSQVIDSFTEVLMSLQQNTQGPLPFNVAAGKKLSEFPMIQMALHILQLTIIQPFNTISLFIRSPYLAYAEEEQAQRCQLDRYLRCHVENRITLEQLAQISQQQHCPQLSQLIRHLIPFANDKGTTQYPSDWAKHLSKKLQASGWPGQRPLLSEEFQLLERWSKLLSEFSRFDFILGKISEEMAWQELHHLATQSLFQAKTSQDPSIHIVGLLDTAGLCFDSLWVMGLDDRTWPATAHPNPFIPYSLQRAHQLPHASNEREYYFSSLITQRLLMSAQEVILSHPSQVKEQPLLPSPLIKDIPSIEKKDLGLPPYQTIIESIWKTRRWEYYVDEIAPPLETHELTSVGSQLFTYQAACPFQAFARLRLDANFYPFPKTGLNAIDRGILLHDVIETFWNTVGDQSTLLKQSAQTLQTLIKQSIDSGITKFSKKRPVTFQAQFIQIERERLQQRLMKLIELDKKRLSFIKVTHEIKRTLRLGKLTLDLRIDRLDELVDGSLLIIDYKTGIPKKYHWFEERLDQPQLPLYCLSYPAATGFAILHIRSNTLEIQGLSEKENGLSPLLSREKDKNVYSNENSSAKSIVQTWPELLAYWEHSLTALADQFQEGFAKVDPKYGSSTCRLCQLKSLCRISHHE